MAEFGLIGGSYESQSPIASAERTRNWYPERIEANGVTSMALYPCPGLAEFCELTDSPVWCEKTINGRTFAVAGATLFECFQDGTFTNHGTVARGTTPATIATSATEMLIVSGGQAYSYILATNVLTRLTQEPADVGGLMLSVPSMCGYLAGYFVVLLANSNQFQWSGLNDVSAWDPTDTTQVSLFPDNILSMLVDHGELWFFGNTKSIGYGVTSDTNDPLQPIPGAFIEQGCGAQFSPCRLDNTILWWGADERGSMIAWRAEGYRPTRVSTHALEFEVQGYATSSDAICYAYQDQGHTFWVTYFPSAGTTKVYDCATGLWHDRTHLSNGVEGAHLSQCHVFAFGKHLVGDWSSGKIYQMAIPRPDGSGGYDFADDDGAAIRRSRISAAVFIENKRIQHTYFEALFETGLGPVPALTDGDGNERAPQCMFSWSNDGTKTWSNEYILDCGKAGEYEARVFMWRLGIARKRVYQIACTDAIPWRLIDGYVLASPGFQTTERMASQARKGA